MEIRQPDATDIEAIVDLWVRLAADQQAYGSHLLADENRAPIRETISRHVISDGLLVARESTLIGFVMFREEVGQFKRTVTRGIIENIYVIPDRRGEGIGSELLNAAEVALVAGGAEVIVLEVLADNEDAQRFYREHGYEPHRMEFARELNGTD